MIWADLVPETWPLRKWTQLFCFSHGIHWWPVILVSVILQGQPQDLVVAHIDNLAYPAFLGGVYHPLGSSVPSYRKTHCLSGGILKPKMMTPPQSVLGEASFPTGQGSGSKVGDGPGDWWILATVMGICSSKWRFCVRCLEGPMPSLGRGCGLGWIRTPGAVAGGSDS